LNSAPDIGASGLPQVYLSPRRGISVFPHKAMCGEVEHTFFMGRWMAEIGGYMIET
jgi:hypothetical protein